MLFSYAIIALRQRIYFTGNLKSAQAEMGLKIAKLYAKCKLTLILPSKKLVKFINASRRK